MRYFVKRVEKNSADKIVMVVEGRLLGVTVSRKTYVRMRPPAGINEGTWVRLSSESFVGRSTEGLLDGLYEAWRTMQEIEARKPKRAKVSPSNRVVNGGKELHDSLRRISLGFRAMELREEIERGLAKAGWDEERMDKVLEEYTDAIEERTASVDKLRAGFRKAGRAVRDLQEKL